MENRDRYRRIYAVVQFLLGVGLWILLGLAGPEGAFRGFPDPSANYGFASAWAQVVLLISLALCSFAALRLQFNLDTGFFVSMDVTFALPVFFLISPFVAILLAGVVLACDYIYVYGRRLAGGWYGFQLVGNLGNRMLRLGFAWLAYSLCGGRVPLGPDETQALPALAALAAYFVSNNLFYVPSEYWKGGSLKSFFRESVTVDATYTILIGTLGYFMALATVNIGPWALLILLVIVLGASWLFFILARTQQALKSKLEDLLALNEVTAASSSGLDVLPMVESFTRKLAKVLDADGIGVIFYQRYSTTLYLVQCEGEKSRATYLPEEIRFQYEQLPLSDPSERLGKRLFEFLQPLETAPFMVPPSCFGVPLLHGGEPFGGIVVYSYDEGVSFNRRKSLLETCAQALVVGLENCFLHLQAIQDSLTGLFNRSYFLYRLEEELSYSSRHNAPFSILMVDLDDFKAVNDFLGHEHGDRVLHRIGDLLRSSLRREDVPARYGGDEFVILLVNCDEEATLQKAENIRNALATRALPKEEAKGLAIGCSIGVLTSNNLRGEQDIPSLLRRLDQALYQAKRAGKNRVVVAE